VFLFAIQAAVPREAVARMPWKTIFLVVGISTAVGLVGRLGGLDWFQDFVARVSTPQSVHAVLASLTGLISAYSSTSGVVLPAFLPQAPGIAARLPGVDAIALATTINVGSALVDVSPLSTIGALCVAATPPGEDARRLYRSLLLWGFLMIPLAAAFCYAFAPLFQP
jgi:di/tricarboxylate transporter